jgi:hypothetical protein
LQVADGRTSTDSTREPHGSAARQKKVAEDADASWRKLAYAAAGVVYWQEKKNVVAARCWCRVIVYLGLPFLVHCFVSD